MSTSTEKLASWNQAAYDAAMSYARASMESAEQLLRLNLETARSSLEQNSKVTRELLSVSDPQQLMTLRTKLAETSMQQSAAYAHSVYEIVSQTQAHLAKLFEEQVSRVSKDVAAGAAQIGQTTPGADISTAALQSTLAATSAMMDSVNQATRQFAELSEATIKAATAHMVKGTGKR